MKKEELYDCLVNKQMTLEETGKLFNVSRQRVHQMLKKHYPELTRKDYGVSKKTLIAIEQKVQRWLKERNKTSGIHSSDLAREMSLKFTRKRQNAKSTGWTWELTMSDLQWNLVCPILGIDLDWFADFRQDNSPSFDRIDNTKGYIPGNVQIISWRANRIKNDGTALEHRKIAEYLESLQR